MNKETLRNIANGNETIFWTDMGNNIPTKAFGVVTKVNKNSINVLAKYDIEQEYFWNTELFYDKEYGTYANKDTSVVCIYKNNDYETVVGNLYKVDR